MYTEIPEEIEQRTAALTKQLRDFPDDFAVERRRRIEREAEVVRRLGVHEDEVAAAFEVERDTREIKVVALTTTLDDTIRHS